MANDVHEPTPPAHGGVGIAYASSPLAELTGPKGPIASFFNLADGHVDAQTVDSFGDEWTKFSSFSEVEIQRIGDEYFDIVGPDQLGPQTTVLDLGCGSGRWARYLADRVRFVEAMDPSDAVFVAARMNADKPNVRVTQAGVDNIPFPDASFDLLVCLGVLHHVPNTPGAVAKAAKKIKPGGHFLLYLYYSLDNRGRLYRALFKVANLFRRAISSMPKGLKLFVCDVLAFVVYCPFVMLAWLVKQVLPGRTWEKLPLSYYVGKSIHVIRNDALDRFGTPLEQRFSRPEITQMLEAAGMEGIRFSEQAPYWHVISRKI